MYQVFKNKRVMFKGEAFASFEKARQAVRKHIRAKMKPLKYMNTNDNIGLWDSTSRNPTSYTILGFRIFKVA